MKTRSLNLTREYLQARILSSLQRSGAMIPLAFLGGTCLRFLHSLPRHSEDLDFALDGDRSAYDFRAFVSKVKADSAAEGYPVEVKLSDARVVHSAMIRFPGLLHDLGLSPHRSQILSIKIEVDTRPPEGAGLATTLVRRHVTLNLHHHDRPSLLAGKLHAVLQRPYTKGRDIFDLFWYLADPDWPEPNLVLLNNALAQTGWKGVVLTLENWQDAILDRLEDLDFERARADVEPFLAPEADQHLFTSENLRRLLES